MKNPNLNYTETFCTGLITLVYNSYLAKCGLKANYVRIHA